MTLAKWSECARCSRRVGRLGVVAPEWRSRPRLLVLGARADRATQITRRPSPRLEGFAFELGAALGIAQDEVAVDALLACGLGATTAIDHVAACSARFVENQRAVGQPDLVVIVGYAAALAAQAAGLVVASRWRPVGCVSAPCIFAPDLVVSRALLSEARSTLGLRGRRERRAPPQLGIAHAQQLLSVLGSAKGSGKLSRGAAKWRRWKTAPLRAEDVEKHFAGTQAVAPFHPHGPWPYVVVDIDRHNALQAEVFEETVRAARDALPGSLAVRSSASGGVHVYVRLPPDTTYEIGATWLRAFLALRGVMWRDADVRRGDRDVCVRTLLLEVLDQPPRLPFGAGSHVLDDTGTLREQFDDFISFVTSAPPAAFEAAKRDVMSKLGVGDVWSPEKKQTLLRVVEVAEVGSGRLPRPDPGDPWTNVLAEFKDADAALRNIATRGVPAMGTRTRWTTRLIAALMDIVDPDRARELMKYWLHNREHHSEDIEADPLAVERTILKQMDRREQHLAGVPEGSWRAVEQKIADAYRVVTPGNIRLMSRGNKEVTLGVVLRTGFFIVRKFFTKGAKGERQVRIGAREFHRFAHEDVGPRIREIFELGGWLQLAGEYHPKIKARTFALDDRLLRPPLPGERILFVPP